MGQKNEGSPLLARNSPQDRQRGSPTFAGSRKPQHELLKILILALGIITIVCIPLGLWTKASQYPPFTPNEPAHPRPGSQSAEGEIPKDDFGHLPVRPTRGICKPDMKYNIASRSFDVTFAGGKGISIAEGGQRHETGHGTSLGVFGHLAVRPYRDYAAKSGQTGAITVDIVSNLPSLSEEIQFNFNTDSQELELIFPRKVLSQKNTLPCVGVNMTLWVPPKSAVLDTLSADVLHLDVLLAETVDLKLEKMTLKTTAGDISGASIEDDKKATSALRTMPLDYKLLADNIVANTMSGDIKGSWNLAEKLNLQTTSGGVTVNVVPLEMDTKADLRIQTISGDIMVKEEGVKEGKVPGRKYETMLKSISGSIDGHVAFGGAGDFQAISGDMKMDLLPVIDRAAASEQLVGLVTDTKSGDTKMHLLEPMYYGVASEDEGLAGLKSKHQTMSGDIKLKYPESWEGFVHLGTRSGDIKTSGKRLKVTKRHESPSDGKVVEAINGVGGPNEGSNAQVTSISGDLGIYIGSPR